MGGSRGPVHELFVARKIKSVYKIKFLKQSDQSNVMFTESNNKKSGLVFFFFHFAVIYSLKSSGVI